MKEIGNYFDNLENNVDTSMLKKSDISSTNDDMQILIDEFKKERIVWTEKIIEENKKLLDIKNIPMLQFNLYTYRQVLVEKRGNLSITLSKLNKKLKEKRKDGYLKYKTNYDINFKNFQDLNIFIDDYIKDWTEKISLLETQISFIDDTITTVDRMIFGIKFRLSAEDLIVGNTKY